MNDQRTAPTATDAISSSVPDLNRLHRRVEGWLDADLLLAEEGDTLLEAIASARRSLEAGDREAAHGHTSRLMLAVEALVQSGMLDAAPGRAALAAARRMREALAGCAARRQPASLKHGDVWDHASLGGECDPERTSRD